MMLNSRVLKVVILLTLFSSSLGVSQLSKETKSILILLSNSSDVPAYKKILNGIVQELTNEFGHLYTLHTEYLQLRDYPQGKYPKEKFDLYNEKYRDVNIDLLICIGVNVITPVKNFADSYLLNLPTVSTDLDFSNYGYNTDLRLNEQTAVLGLNFNIEKTLSTALSLFPGTSSIYFVSGTSPLDKFLLLVTKDASNKILNNIETTFDTDLSMDETLEQVRNLPKNSIIFVPYYTTDTKLVRYHNTEAVRLMNREANAPIFHVSDLGIGDGLLGGYVMSFVKVGKLTGEVAVKILNGADPNSIAINESDYSEYIFDWRELKKWNLENSDLIPEGSTILFKEITLWGEYKWIIITGLFFLFLQSLLIINLIRLNRNQKMMTKKILETENRYRDFLHEDRSLRLGQLTASLSHEINQPLTAILSNAQAGINFINSNEAKPELLKQILQKIVDNDKRGASILKSIRGMMKLESREKEKVNINSLIDDVVAVYQGEATKQDIKLNISLSDEPIFIFADRIQIQQVLLNLISNASHSMGKTKVSKKEITVSDTVENDDVIVSVRDRGKGIDESIKEKLF
ncbi:MAG: HAMP domain-containing sensor histidine kinase, partial [Ignavibacteriaceae bacterium]